MRWLTALSVLLLALPVWAADGDAVTDITLNVPEGGKAYYLCHDKVEASSTCAEFDILGKIPSSGVRTATVTITESESCSSTTDVNIDTNVVPTADCPEGAGLCEVDWVNLSSTVLEAVVDWTSARSQRYLNTNLTNMTGCADAGGGGGFDVVIIFYPVIYGP